MECNSIAEADTDRFDQQQGLKGREHVCKDVRDICEMLYLHCLILEEILAFSSRILLIVNCALL